MRSHLCPHFSSSSVDLPLQSACAPWEILGVPRMACVCSFWSPWALLLPLDGTVLDKFYQPLQVPSSILSHAWCLAMQTLISCIIQATLPWLLVRFSQGTLRTEEQCEVRVFISCHLPAVSGSLKRGYSSYHVTYILSSSLLVSSDLGEVKPSCCS